MKHNGEHTEEISLDKTGSLKSIELAPAELKKAQELSARIRPDDYTSVTEFGSDIQQEISEFAGHLLERVRSRDADSISASVTELMLKIKGVDVKKLSEPATGMAKVPWIGRWFDQVKKLKSQYEKLESQIDFIQSRLNEAYVELHKDTEMLDLLLQKNHSYFKSLEIHIAAVEMRLDELNQHEIPDMKQKAETTQNPLYAQKLNELVDFAAAWKKSSMISSAPVSFPYRSHRASNCCNKATRSLRKKYSRLHIISFRCGKWNWLRVWLNHAHLARCKSKKRCGRRSRKAFAAMRNRCGKYQLRSAVKAKRGSSRWRRSAPCMNS